MFPVLLEIPNAWTLSFGALFAEIVVGLACGLGWLTCHLRKRHETVGAILNTGAVLVVPVSYTHLTLPTSFLG